MTTLLRLDASIRNDNSVSRSLADFYQQNWEAHHSNGNVVFRDLAHHQIPHLSNDLVEAFQLEEPEQSDVTRLSDELIKELKNVDQLLISSPLYNLSLPSTLKSYFDHIVRSGHTFEVQGNELVGLLKGISAVIITTRGGISDAGVADDFQTDYLKQILSFVGITNVRVISAEGTTLDEPEKSHYFSLATEQISDIFNKQEIDFWKSDFSSSEQKEINSLRVKQAQAIMNGDAKSYADLCTDDVTLMIPDHDIIRGRTSFFKVEEKLFKTNSFSSFKKSPESIERQGNIAIELGRQEVTMNNVSNKTGVFSSKQKYMHVFRLTQLGWRYATLMSNPSE